MSTTIETFGSIRLVQDGNFFFLYSTGGTAVELMYGGAPVLANQFGTIAPIGAEQTANGYEVAWKVPGADTYSVWLIDNNGNYISNSLSRVSGANAALQSMETSFQQDLNGDGTIGPATPSSSPPASSPAVVESFGSTSLTQIDTHFYLYGSDGTGPSLKYQGADYVAGQFGQITPIAAEQTATGYDVAWKVSGADQYSVWATDNNGNYVANILSNVSGASTALQSIETSFHQDLNGDGTIGSPSSPPPASSPTVIESFGSTSLTKVGTLFYLYDSSSGAGPSLKYQGADYVSGQFGSITPIAAEKTASGYEVAWKVPGADQYAVWTTDNNGNYVANILNNVSGASTALQSIETSFHQDLNGDGTISSPSQTSSPQFVYQGVDADGAQLYSVTWASAGLQPFAVRVLAPDHPSTNVAHSFLYALPVEAGLAQSTWGDGLEQLQQLDVQDRYNATIIEPIFPIAPWYANSTTDPTINYESFMATLLPAWVDSNFATTGTEDNLLIGFSKSGYGALDLLFKHSDVFDAAAAWDFPADMANYTDFGADVNYGTDANFQNNYRLTDAFIDTWKAPFTAENRIWISGYDVFQSDVSDFDALLTSDGVLHTLGTQTFDAHNWFSGWLSGAVAGLYGLEDGGADVPPPPPPSTTVVENLGATTLTKVGTHFYLYDSSGTGPSLKYQGGDYVNGQFGSITPIGAEQTANGYEVAWKPPGVDQYSVWLTDSNGNYLSNALTSVPGASGALQSIETSFHQDLNGDGTIGPPAPSGPTVVESFGSTSLTEVGTHFYLYDSSGTGPSLKYQGADYVDGQFGSITPIGAEQTANGYEVAWKPPGVDQYSVWLTDSNGNYLSNALTSVPGASGALQSIETSFHQDLNGDGTIGPPAPSGPTVVESFGSTSLTEVGTHFYLYDSSGTGPSLKYQGADYVDGQFGSITPIGAEQTANGYEVAWKPPGVDQYSVWLTDSNGNYLSNALTSVPGASGALQSIETSFHQDLNGDGTIGPRPTVVESFGSTSLTEVGTHFYLYDSSGTGPSLKYQGVDYVDGQFGPITPIAAEQTANGYEVAWKPPGVDQYSVWLTDNNGNYLSNALTSVPGASGALQSIETSFHQDLNGDGYQGIVLDGSSGGQTLAAGSSPTTLIGGPNDILSGGSSADTFVFRPDFGANTINNFSPGTDELQFDHSIFADANAARSVAQQVGSDVVIAHDGSDVVTLHDMQLAALHASNFDII